MVTQGNHSLNLKLTKRRNSIVINTIFKMSLFALKDKEQDVFYKSNENLDKSSRALRDRRIAMKHYQKSQLSIKNK